MTTLTEIIPHVGGFVVSEANGFRSRDTVTIAAGADVRPGEVLGKITASGKYTARAAGAVDGSQVAVAIAYAGAPAAAAGADCVVIARDAEVATADLVWPAGADQAARDSGVAELAAVGIIAR